MPITDTGRTPVWISRFRPYDLTAGVERNVWFATTDLATDEPFEGWLTFDGANDSVVVPDAASLDFSSTLAVGVRFRTNVAQNAALVLKSGRNIVSGGIGPGYGVGLLSTNTSLRAFTAGLLSRTDATFASAAYADGEWHTIIAARMANGDLRIDYDGATVVTVPASQAPTGPNEIDLLFGANSSGGERFDGDMERVVVFGADAVVSAASLLASRDLTASVVDGAPVTSLVGAWPINEGYGLRVQDVSGDLNHGALVGVGPILRWSRIAPPPGTIPGLLRAPFRVSASLLRGGNRLSTNALPSFGSVKLLNPDGALDYLLEHSWSHRLSETLLGFDGDLVTAYDVIWVGQAEDPNGVTREEFSVGIRGVEDIFEEDLQQRRHTPGFEPSVIFDGSNNQIDFGDVLDRGLTTSFIIGCAFRTSTLQDAGLYGKKFGRATNNAGYLLSLGAAGAIRIDVADGTNLFSVAPVPPGGYDTGTRISVVGVINRTANELSLHWNPNDGTGWAQIGGNVGITGLGNLDNAASLFAGRHNGGEFFDGEIERVCQDGFNAGAGQVQAFLDERFPEDADVSWAGVNDHAVPLTENAGTLVGDLARGGHDGTISGDADPDNLWSGTPNGNRDIEGLPVPIVEGRVSLRRVRWVDTQKLIAQVSDSAFVNDVFGVREGFVPIAEDTTTMGDIFTNAPAAGEWRWQAGFFVNGTLPGTFIRLGSQPTGTVTASIDRYDVTGSPSDSHPGSLAVAVANRVASSFIFGELAINTAAPYISGHYWDEPISGRRALDEVLASAGASWTIDPRTAYDGNGDLRIVIFQPRDVSAETPSATYLLDPDDQPPDFEKEGFRQTGIAPVYRTVTLRYLRYGEPLSLSEPQAIGAGVPVPFDVVTELTREWRQVVRPAAQEDRDAILAQFLGAEDYETDTGIWVRASAVAEADRLVTLYNRLGRVYEGELTQGLFAHWIGDVVDVTGTRLLGDGTSEVTQRFLVVGVTDDANKSGSVLELWGGFEPA